MNRRAATLAGEYSNHARDIDREYGGVAFGVVGLVQAKLLSFPPLRGRVFCRGTPTPGSWPGVGGGNYSDAGVGEKCFDCGKENRSSLEVTSQRGS